MRRSARLGVMLLAMLPTAMPRTAFAVFGSITLISQSIDGGEADDESIDPVVNADGSVIAYVSSADDLVQNDNNSSADIFVFDQRAGTTTRIVGLTGEFSGDSSAPEISDDGQFVAFVEGGTLRVINRATGGLQDVVTLNYLPYAFSGNGRFLAITADDSQQLSATDHNGVSDIYLFDRLTQSYERISRKAGLDEPNDKSFIPAVTPDGRYVGFVSSASNLVANDNGRDSIFVLDRIADTVERVSGFAADETDLVSDPVPPALSADGQFVAYLAIDSAGAVQVYLRDRTAQTTTRLAVGPSTMPELSTNTRVSLSRDAGRVLYGVFGDLVEDIFVFDRSSATTNIVSRSQDASDGDSIAARLNPSGRAIVFASDASNLVADGASGFENNIYLATSGLTCAGVGDINCDGKIDAADISALIALIFGGGS